jgi:HAE1 family hydrophobic/amphiphilic exporter-1
VHLGVEEEQRQITIRINSERVAQYGLQDQAVASLIDESNRGALATEFVDFDRKIPVTLQLPNEMRYDLANLKLLRIQGVPVGELIEVKDTVGAAEIHRESQSRVVTVYADVIQGGLDQAVAEINDAILPLKLSLPEDFTLDVGGENEEMRKSFLNLAFAFGLALVLVYMILAIMIAVPLALIGALLGLWVAGAGLNTMSLIGVVILVGIVVNDAIVKVDFINQMRASGMAVRQAILEAGKVRLRPIIMTTVTTVFGLLPMAMGIGRGADLRAPLAIAVIGGLSVATVLTLIVVPVVYSLIESMRGLVIKDVDDGSSPASEASVAT